jgi:hypothetical protein
MSDGDRVGGVPDAMERVGGALRAATDALSGCRPAVVRWQYRTSGDQFGDRRTTDAFSTSCGQWDRALAELTQAVRALGEEIATVARSLREAGS